MKLIGTHNYFVYILTNWNKTVLYTGMTNDIRVRLWQHRNHVSPGSFTSRYKVYYLVYFEHFDYVWDAIHREKQIKTWSRKKKDALINSFNPEWNFLNENEF